MRVVVTGSRHITDADFVFAALDTLEPQPTVIVQGGARGVDSLALRWARQNQVDCETFNADWKRLGRTAGPVRNEQMLATKPDLVVAFPIAGSTGTWDCVNKAYRMGIEVKVVERCEGW